MISTGRRFFPETDPNKLYDLVAIMEGHQICTHEEIKDLVALYLDGADRDRLDPILDVCAARYKNDLTEDEQIAFKGAAKIFTRTYGFLGAILPYGNADWERLSIFLNCCYLSCRHRTIRTWPRAFLNRLTSIVID
jgi:type I restriction enzyme R subunit